MNSMKTQDKRLLGITISIAAILLIPLVAMQFTDEVNWKLNDFLVAGALLFGTGFLIELVIRKVSKKEVKHVLLLAIVILLLLVWIEMAVGLFGTPIAGS